MTQARHQFRGLRDNLSGLLQLVDSIPSTADEATRQSLLAAVEKIAKCDEEMGKKAATLVEVRHMQMDANKKCTTMADIEKQFEEEVAKVQGPFTALDGLVLQVKENLQKANDGNAGSAEDDDDIDEMVTQITYVNKDPISKKEIDHPVKNTNCGHVYDRDTIEEYIAGLVAKKFLHQCPVGGCQNKKNLNMADLRDFPEFFDLCKSK